MTETIHVHLKERAELAFTYAKEYKFRTDSFRMLGKMKQQKFKRAK